MKLIPYSDDHYATIAQWFHQRGRSAPEKALLPKTGVLALNAFGDPVAAGFLVSTDAGYGIMNNLVAKLSAERNEKKVAITLIIDRLSEMAKNMGFRLVSMASNVPSVHERLEAQGFMMVEENVKYFWRNLCQ